MGLLEQQLGLESAKIRAIESRVEREKQGRMDRVTAMATAHHFEQKGVKKLATSKLSATFGDQAMFQPAYRPPVDKGPIKSIQNLFSTKPKIEVNPEVWKTVSGKDFPGMIEKYGGYEQFGKELGTEGVEEMMAELTSRANLTSDTLTETEILQQTSSKEILDHISGDTVENLTKTVWKKTAPRARQAISGQSGTVPVGPFKLPITKETVDITRTGSEALSAGGAEAAKGTSILGKASGVFSAASGVHQMFTAEGPRKEYDIASGAAKTVGGAMVATGVLAPVGGALIIGSTLADIML